MKRRILAIVAVAIVMCTFVCTLSGCADANDHERPHQSLTVVGEEKHACSIPGLGHSNVYRLLDTETGVEYWYVISYHCAGLAPRLNADGSPIVIDTARIQEGE